MRQRFKKWFDVVESGGVEVVVVRLMVSSKCVVCAVEVYLGALCEAQKNYREYQFWTSAIVTDIAQQHWALPLDVTACTSLRDPLGGGGGHGLAPKTSRSSLASF